MKRKLDAPHASELIDESGFTDIWVNLRCMDRFRWWYPQLDQACEACTINGSYSTMGISVKVDPQSRTVSPFELHRILQETLGMPASHFDLSFECPLTGATSQDAKRSARDAGGLNCDRAGPPAGPLVVSQDVSVNYPRFPRLPNEGTPREQNLMLNGQQIPPNGEVTVRMTSDGIDSISRRKVDWHFFVFVQDLRNPYHRNVFVVRNETSIRSLLQDVALDAGVSPLQLRLITAHHQGLFANDANTLESYGITWTQGLQSAICLDLAMLHPEEQQALAAHIQQQQQQQALQQQVQQAPLLQGVGPGYIM